MLYVRTEERSGRPAPEHLFVETRGRVVFQRWVSKVPAEFELILDTDGREHANEARWMTKVTEHNLKLALGLLKKAASWLPSERARELRQEWVGSAMEWT